MNEHLNQALESARCCQVNLNNIEQLIPILATHPYMLIVKMQLGEVIKELEQIKI